MGRTLTRWGPGEPASLAVTYGPEHPWRARLTGG
jgi:hypothetical protein